MGRVSRVDLGLTFYLPDSVVGPGYIVVSKIDQKPCCHGAHIRAGESDNKISK